MVICPPSTVDRNYGMLLRNTNLNISGWLPNVVHGEVGIVSTCSKVLPCLMIFSKSNVNNCHMFVFVLGFVTTRIDWIVTFILSNPLDRTWYICQSSSRSPRWLFELFSTCVNLDWKFQNLTGSFVRAVKCTLLHRPFFKVWTSSNVVDSTNINAWREFQHCWKVPSSVTLLCHLLSRFLLIDSPSWFVTEIILQWTHPLMPLSTMIVKMKDPPRDFDLLGNPNKRFRLRAPPSGTIELNPESTSVETERNQDHPDNGHPESLNMPDDSVEPVGVSARSNLPEVEQSVSWPSIF